MVLNGKKTSFGQDKLKKSIFDLNSDLLTPLSRKFRDDADTSEEANFSLFQHPCTFLHWG